MKDEFLVKVEYPFNVVDDSHKIIACIYKLMHCNTRISKKNIKYLLGEHTCITGWIDSIDFDFALEIVGIGKYDCSHEKIKSATRIYNRLYKKSIEADTFTC